MAFRPFVLVLSAAALQGVLLVGAQTTHTIYVGISGDFFDPPTVYTEINDTVSFIFDPESIHTVRQSSLDNPCTPLPGGFGSGAVSGVIGINDTLDLVIWDLHITDTSTIWFFCETAFTKSHCVDSGMVGAINPPSIDAYNSFREAAQKVTGTPQPNFQMALTGIGAFATQAPTPSTNATTALTPASTSHRGAVVGGAVGAAVVIILVLIGIIWHLRVQRSRRNGGTQGSLSASSEDDNFFLYDPRPVPRRRPSEVFAEEKQLEVARGLSATRELTPLRMPSAAPAPPMTSNHEAPRDPFFPGVSRMLHGEKNALQNRQMLFGSTAMSYNGNSSAGDPSAKRIQQQMSNFDFHPLPSEVPSILQQR